MPVKKSRWQYIPVTIWTILIILLSTKIGIQVPFSWEGGLEIDKIGHTVFYTIHSLLLAWGLYGTRETTKKKGALLKIFLLSSLLGIVMEIIQYSFYPNRYFEILDIIANISGSLIGIVIFKKILSING